MNKKIIAITFVSIFLFGSNLSLQAFELNKIKEQEIPLIEVENVQNIGNTLYVGGSGPNNYTTIKGAVNSASYGDTIFVYDDSSPYYENFIYITKPINLIGENRDTTVIDGQGQLGSDIIVIDAHDVTVSGFTIKNGGSDFNPFNYGGIHIYGSNNIITDNIITYSHWGIKITKYMTSSNYNTISNNIIKYNDECGIYVQNSNNNVFSMNTFSDNSRYYGGLALDKSNYNNVSDNVFINEGISTFSSYNNDFFNNLVNDKPLVYMEDEADKIIDGNAGQIVLIKCDNIAVQNHNITNTNVGLFLENTHNCFISDNTFSLNTHGMLLSQSNNNELSMNTISKGRVAMYLMSSQGNTILSNYINSNYELGINLYSSSYNNILLNTYSDNNVGLSLDGSRFNNVTDNIFLNDGVWVYGSYKNNFSNNLVNDKPLLYLEDESDIVIDDEGGVGQILLVSCNRITIQNQDISNAVVGILLVNTHDCSISDNTLNSNKWYGLFVTNCDYNNILMNTITDTISAITLDSCHYNTISDNTLHSNSYEAIWLSNSNSNILSSNSIKNNSFIGTVAIRIHTSNDNKISSNVIKNNGWNGDDEGLGVFILESSGTEITYNDFINNGRDAYFNDAQSTIWNGNYWNKPRLFPKIIIGESADPFFDLRINFDWYPALGPNSANSGGIPSQQYISQQPLTKSSTSQAMMKTAQTGSLKINVKHSIFKIPIIDACVVALKDIETDDWYYLDTVGLGVYQIDNLPVGEYLIGTGKEEYTIDCATIIIEEGEQTTHTFYIKPEFSGNFNVKSETSTENTVQQISQQLFTPTCMMVTNLDSDFLLFQANQPRNV
jgi:parallel beta-helix repeat protein